MIRPQTTCATGKNSFPARRMNQRGGATINLITAAIFFGLLALATWWVIKGWGEATEEYTGAMIEAKHDALSVKCQMNMRTIGQNIQIYSISNEGLPESMEELRRFGGGSDLYRCPAPDGAEYIYIPGQTGDMPGSNILIFEPNAVHDGHCSVLLLGGTVGLITPEQLEKALAQTEAEVRSPRR
ncbi:MAG: hypothetical protein ISS79_10145 [Phycisphaerae bacterium]|nr:hypothetical protein [Phycisphaerae bacterium]